MSTLRVSIPAAMRGAFAMVQAVSEPLAARLAERWFFSPPRRRASEGVDAFLSTGRRSEQSVDGRSIVGWEWGVGPVVYLVHGWGSRGGRLRAFMEPLTHAGYRVVTFDAPGHGESGGRLSSMPEFARALRAVVERFGSARAIIAHSLGSSATALAASWGVEAQRFVLIAPAADPPSYADAFGAALGARPTVLARARANSEHRLGFSWTELDVCAVGRRMTVPALIVHDRGDEVVPFSEGAAIAASWPGARLLATSGLGHRGVLHDPGVVSQILEFVTDEAFAPARLSTTGQLEHELFHRETRWR